VLMVEEERLSFERFGLRCDPLRVSAKQRAREVNFLGERLSIEGFWGRAVQTLGTIGVWGAIAV